MRHDLTRKAVAEFIGTALLVAVVVGSGIAAQRLSPGDIGLQLFENAAATAAGLIAIILTIGPVSGAHLNPVVSAADALFGGLDTRGLFVYAAAQVAGAIGGAVVANLMFSLPAVAWSTTSRSGGGVWLGEVVATAGLLLVVFGSVRSGRTSAAPFAVGAYIGAAYWFTSSTSFANPAVTIGRAFSNTFAGIEPAAVPAFVVFELVGAGVAVALVRFLYPDGRVVADDVVVPTAVPAAMPNADRRDGADREECRWRSSRKPEEPP
jgi:glycerol uptake facilitator-like aquaporin